MSDPMLHISSAVLRVSPGRDADVAAALAAMGCEVALSQAGRMVVLTEGPSSGAIGALLTEMTMIDGVLSACMVYEQSEPLNSMGDVA